MEKQIVHLFVFDSLSDWEPGYTVAAINGQDFQKQPGRFAVKTVGASKEPVTTTGGLRILPDMTLDELEPSTSALLILVGGNWETKGNDKAVEKAQQFLAAGVPVAAICGATFALAKVGLLDNRPHTSNAPEYLKMTGYRGEAYYQNQPAVTDGELITAAGTAPLEFAYQILKKLEVYETPILEAWYGLYKTGDPAYFYKLQPASVS